MSVNQGKKIMDYFVHSENYVLHYDAKLVNPKADTLRTEQLLCTVEVSTSSCIFFVYQSLHLVMARMLRQEF